MLWFETESDHTNTHTYTIGNCGSFFILLYLPFVAAWDPEIIWNE